jgi:LuxR family transcriptional regulator, maltose regulon positive regulatory protein
MENRIPITKTKVLIPRRRADLLTRERLLNMMTTFLDLKLVIIAAPAGYGKTSLLIDFLHHNNLIPACWYALDALDQDPQRFVAHLIASISQRFPKFGRASIAAINSASPDSLDLDMLTSVIVNDISENIREHFFIVLDDYHLIEESKPVTYFINQFIQLSDENCQLIIASRTLLNLPDMPLMVARSQVGGLSFEVLSFMPEEIVQLWDHNFGVDISKEEATELAQQTEGWITGLLLTQQTTGRLADRMIRARVAGVGLYDYLAQQVLERQDEEIQKFLLRTSLLDEFDAQMCADVIGSALEIDAEWGLLVEELLRLNLFLQPVGDENHFWLRYHHLFRDFLNDRMQHLYPEEARAIELSLANTWVHRGEWERAYEIYRRAGKTAELARVVELAGPALIARGRLNLLSEWLETVPIVERLGHPELLSIQGSVSAMKGSGDDGLRLLDQAITTFEQADNSSSLGRALVRRATANFQMGRYTQSLADSKRALDLIGPSDDQVIAAEAMNWLGMNYYRLSELQNAWNSLEQSRNLFQTLGDDESAAKIAMNQGMVAKALGQFNLAERAYAEALDYYQESGNRIWQATLLNNLGVLQHQKGSYEAAVNSFERAIQYAQAASFAHVEAYALTSIGDLYRDICSIEESREAYRQARPVTLRINDRFLLFYLDLSEAVLAHLEKHPEKSQRLLHLAWQATEISGSLYQQNLVRLERGAAWLARSCTKEALIDLREAATAFEHAGHRGEQLRANYFLAAAAYTAGEKTESLTNLNRVYAAINDSGSQNLLSSTGRELLNFLKTVQDEPEFEDAAIALLLLAQNFEKQLPHMRRQLRRQTQSVPLGPPRISVTTLGRVQVRANNKLITNTEWVGQSSRDLFLFLLAQPEGALKTEAEAIIWPDGSLDNAGLRFKNAVYRVRKAVGKETILFEGNIYRFNHALDYEEDAETFERMIELAHNTSDVKRRIQHFEAALKVYKGTYLPDIHFEWAQIRRSRLRVRYLEGLLDLARLYMEMKQYDQALISVEHAIDEDHLFEEAYQLGMQIHDATDNSAGVHRLYERCCKALLAELGHEPGENTRQLYETLKH